MSSFHPFGPKIACFCQNFYETFHNLRACERSFGTIIIFSCFTPRKSTLNLHILKFRLLISFGLMSVYSCQTIFRIKTFGFLLSTNMWKIEIGTLFIPIHPANKPSIHRDNKDFRHFEKGRFTLVLLKLQISFTIGILNWRLEDRQVHHRECVRSSFRGIKVMVRKVWQSKQ